MQGKLVFLAYFVDVNGYNGFPGLYLLLSSSQCSSEISTDSLRDMLTYVHLSYESMTSGMRLSSPRFRFVDLPVDVNDASWCVLFIIKSVFMARYKMR